MSTPLDSAAVAVRAMRIARRKGGQVHKLGTETGDTVRGIVAPNDCHTAAWSFDSATDTHTVKIDPEFLAQDFVLPKTKTSRPRAMRYAHALLRHERWHGLRTDRDIKGAAQWCDENDIAFSTLNVVEDLRIEHMARRDERKAFNWRKYLDDAPFDVDNAIAWLAGAAHNEACMAMVLYTEDDSLVKPKYFREAQRWEGAPTVKRVRSGKQEHERSTTDVLKDFVCEFLLAPNFDALKPLLIDFRDTFPEAKQDASTLSGMPAGRGVGYSPESGDGKTLDETRYPEDGVYDMADPDKLDPLSQGSWDDFAVDGTTGMTMTDAEFAEAVENVPDMTSMRRVAEKMRMLLGQVDSADQRVSESGSRLHASGAMVGDSRSFRASTGHRGIRRVVCIMDQSGSMQSNWHQHGAAFTGALLMLHQQRLMEVTVILTGGRKSLVVPPSMRPSLASRFACAQGCESVDATLTKHEELVRKAETVLIYTDGNLTDGEVRAADWRVKGVDLVGCMVGSDYNRDTMVGHFGTALIAPSGAELATKIVQHVAKRSKR